MPKIKTQIFTKPQIKTNPPMSIKQPVFHIKAITKITTIPQNIPSPRGRLLHTDFTKIHDKINR